MGYTVDVESFGEKEKLIWLKTDVLKVGVTTLGATLYSVQVYQPQNKKWIEVNTHYDTYE